MFGIKRIFKPKVKDTSEKQRLVVVKSERPLREGFNQAHYENIKEALEYQFQNTPQIFKIDNPSKS